MKKKIFMAVIAFALVLCTSIAFVGCGGPKVTAIELATEIKTEYYIGEDLDLDDVLLQVEYEDETYEVIDLEKSMVKGFNTDTVGTRTMTITYEGLICKVQYKVTGVKYTEQMYLYYKENSYFCFYKEGDNHYSFIQYMVNYATDPTNPIAEWNKLKSKEYRDSAYFQSSFTQVFDSEDNYYYVVVNGEKQKIISNDPRDMFLDETWTRYVYIPEEEEPEGVVKYTEQMYLYYKDNTYTCFYREGENQYSFIQYVIDGSTLAVEWDKLQSKEYRDAAYFQACFAQVYNPEENCFYVVFNSVNLKIISNDPGDIFLDETWTRYTPEA